MFFKLLFLPLCLVLCPPGDREDCLVGMSFFVPRDNEDFALQAEDGTIESEAAKVSMCVTAWLGDWMNSGVGC